MRVEVTDVWLEPWGDTLSPYVGLKTKRFSAQLGFSTIWELVYWAGWVGTNAEGS